MYYLGKIISALKSTELKNIDKDNFSILEKNIAYWLHLSVLGGEYLEESSSYQVIEIEKSLVQLESLITVKIYSSSSENKLPIRVFNDWSFPLYQNLVESVSDNLKSHSRGKKIKHINLKPFAGYVQTMEMVDALVSDSDQQSVVFEIVIFRINVYLAYLDEYLDCRDEVTNELNNVLIFLNKYAKNFLHKVLKILIEKASFLKLKIDLRKNSESQSEIDKILLSIKEPNLFSSLIKKIIKHYDFTLADVLGEERIIDESINNKTFRIEPFHHLIRFYNTTNSFSNKDKIFKVEKLLDKLDEAYKIDSDEGYKPLNKVAYLTAKNLIKGTWKRLMLKAEADQNFITCVSHFKDFIEGKIDNLNCEFLNYHYFEFNDINDKIPQYYGFQVYLEFLDALTDFLKSNPFVVLQPDLKKSSDESKESRKYSNEDVEIKHEKINGLSIYLENLYKKTLETLKWNLDKMVLYGMKPVFLAANECFINFAAEDNLNAQLFIASSYVLPNNFYKISSKFKEWEGFLQSHIYPLQTSLDFELTKNNRIYSSENLRSLEEDFLKKVKENEFKIVQIVAMFVSIATFVLINVKIFDNKNGLESFAIIIGLAGCFFVFNLFFYIIIHIQNNKYDKEKLIDWKFWKKPIFLCCFPAMLFVISGLILGIQGEKTGKQIKNIQETILKDSLSLQKIINNPLFYASKDTVFVKDTSGTNNNKR